MRALAFLAAAGFALQGCTTSLQPVGFPPPPGTRGRAANTGAILNESCTPPDTSGLRIDSSKARLTWYACALRNKARANLNQSQAWENRSEWRDIPLMGAAMTVAGLLLFGERNAAGALNAGEQDLIEGIGFGAAGWAAFTNYLNPQNARRLLRQGARGHFCMANEAELLLSVWDSVSGKQTARGTLERLLADLDAALQGAPATTPSLAEIRAIRDAGYRALALYDRQYDALLSADVFLAESAWDFGLDMISLTDRSSVDTEALVRSITEQTTNMANFAQAPRGVEAPVAEALVENEQERLGRIVETDAQKISERNAANSLLDKAIAVAASTRVVTNGLANVEALVLGFDACATAAVAGGDPRAARVQRLTVGVP